MVTKNLPGFVAYITDKVKGTCKNFEFLRQAASSNPDCLRGNSAFSDLSDSDFFVFRSPLKIVGFYYTQYFVVKVFLLSFLFFSCRQNKEQIPTDMVNIPATAGQGLDKNDLPEMKFEEEIFNFGTITQGEKVSHIFRFKNTGNKNLIISNAYADCGCTVPEYPKTPITSGETGIIKITFDSDGKSGIVTKQVNVLTNCIPNTKIIKIKASVFVPKTK